MVKTFLFNLRLKGILCNFRLVSEEKVGKETPESSRLEILEKDFNKKLCLTRCRRQHIRPIKWRRYIRFFVQSDRLFCFINIIKLDRFKKPFAAIDILCKLPFSLSFYSVDTNERSGFYELLQQHRQVKPKV